MTKHELIVNQFDKILETVELDKTLMTEGLIDGLKCRTYAQFKNKKVLKEVKKRVDYFINI